MSEKRDKDRPWVMRTYAGHSSATESNALYRRNLAKGQTGLSVAFDLPTQTGYDPDHPLARGEVGKVGVPVPHLGEMRRLFADIPLADMNTSMTINATAMWLLALYQVVAEEQAGLTSDSDAADVEAVRGRLEGTTQNDIIKEYLSRGTYVFPPEQSLRLTSDLIAYTVNHIPKWNPINICSYHLQEAGATPTQELAFALCTAISVLDTVRDSAQVPPATSPRSSAGSRSSSTRACGSSRRCARCGRSCGCGTRSPASGTASRTRSLRRFRYGVQVNSLGLTEAQPENNVQRIVLEMLGVTLSKDARARAVQLPAWNEALGLPRPWDQQWSLRLQQVLAFESDLLEYDDLFEGSRVVEAKVDQLVASAREEVDRVAGDGRSRSGSGVRLHEAGPGSSHAARRGRIESGVDLVVGVNCYQNTEESPLTAELGTAIQAPDPEAERSAVEGLRRWREDRDDAEVELSLERLARCRRVGGEPDGDHAGRGPRRGDDRGVGRCAARGVRRVPGPDRRRRRRWRGRRR